LEEDAEGRLALAKDCLQAGTLSDAELHLAKLFAKHPKHGEGLLVRGILAMQREAYVEAAIAFEQALHQQADARKARVGLAMSALALKQPARAWAAMVEALKSNPDDAEVIHWLVRAGTSLNSWTPLAEQLSLYVTRNPADLGARFALCGVWIRLDRLPEARREYDYLRALDPSYEGLEALRQSLDGKVSCRAADHAA
jgi:predicted Zn-dependent protease